MFFLHFDQTSTNKIDVIAKAITSNLYNIGYNRLGERDNNKD